MDGLIEVGDKVLFAPRLGGKRGKQVLGTVKNLDYLAVLLVETTTSSGKQTHIVWKHDVIGVLPPDTDSMPIAQRKGES